MPRRQPKNIVIIDGHPDRQPRHLVHALARAYAVGADEGGHRVLWVKLAEIDFPLLSSQHDWEEEPVPPALRTAQEAIRWADHLVILYPLWLGDMPARLKAFLEQVLRPGFAFDGTAQGHWKKALGGRTARIIVTMGMPALVYRLYFLALGVRLLKRNILHFVGIRPVRTMVIGGVEEGRRRNAVQLRKVVQYGKRAL
jgi:putative NADPH-quinone reductase